MARRAMQVPATERGSPGRYRSQYSDINAAAIPLAQITAAPKTALRETPSGYVLVRHNNTAVSARADGQCAGEALHFASGRKELGDAVEAGGTAANRWRHSLWRHGQRREALGLPALRPQWLQ